MTRSLWRLLAALLAFALLASACGDDDTGDAAVDDAAVEDVADEPADDEPVDDAMADDEEPADEPAEEPADEPADEPAATDEACPVGRAGDPAADLLPLSVVVLPIVDVAPIQYAVDCGYYASNGLDVTIEVAASGPDAGQLVASGEANIGLSAWHALAGAWLNDAPFRVAIDGAVIDSAQGNIMVAPDSDIESIADLEGKTIAVNTTGALSDVSLRQAFADAGLDFSTVTMVVVPFPDMIPAVMSGSVDAMTALEPFTTIGASQGLKVIHTDLFGGAIADGSTGGFVARADWAAENEETIRRARAAWVEVTTLFNGDEDGFRAYLPNYTALTPELASVIALTEWRQTTEIANVQPSIDVTAALGLVPEAVSAADVVAYPED